jgi:hypothetical protein
MFYHILIIIYIYSYTMHVPGKIPSTLPMLHTLALSNLPCGTHLYSSNRYVTVLTTVLSSIQLFVHYTDRLIYIAMFFLLQSVHQVCASNK